MPSSFLHEIVHYILEGVLEVGCYYIGRVAVPILTLGQVKCDSLKAYAPRLNVRFGLYHKSGNKIILTAKGTQLAGILTILLLIGTSIYLLSQ